LLIPVPGDPEPPASVPSSSTACIAWKPGYMPMLIWVPPMAQPKKK
jgi:hypothetical protein